MSRQMIQIGNSLGVIIPSELRKQVNFTKKTNLNLDVGVDGRSIIISESDGRKAKTSITPEFVGLLQKVNERYGSALAELSKK